MRGGRIVYICYNGIDEPLVASQVLAYLAVLAGAGYRFTLITFERNHPPRAADRRRELSGRGIDWIPVTTRLRRRGLCDCALLLKCVLAANRHSGPGTTVIHARSFVPALAARLLKLVRPVYLINDIRGFWIEEKVYKGTLRRGGVLHRAVRRLESWVYRGSDHIVCLTDAAQREIAGFPCFRHPGPPPVTTIPTCVDRARFAAPRAARGESLTVGYLGSLSDVYLPEEILRFFARLHAQRPEARLHLVSNSDAGAFHRAAARAGVGRELYRLESAAFDQVPAHVARFDLGLSFIKPGYAKVASCPTKVGEYLAGGVPVIGNAGIGDLDELLSTPGVGHVLADFSPQAFADCLRALPSLLDGPAVAQECRRLAASHFDLQRGARLYGRVYAGATRSDRAPAGR